MLFFSNKYTICESLTPHVGIEREGDRRFEGVLLGILILLNLTAFSQDIHHQKAKSVEELLLKSKGNEAYALFGKEKYLVVEKLKRAKRDRIFVGDVFRFRTKDDMFFQEEIESITDSTFTVSWMNPVMNKYEYVEIRIDEVDRIYRKPMSKGLNLALDAAPLGYLGLDWIQNGIAPWKNKETLRVMAFIYGTKFALMNIGKLFKSRKITENYRLRVLGGK
jgi:hypothetical protein